MLRYVSTSRYSYPGYGCRCCRFPRSIHCVDVHTVERWLLVCVEDDFGLVELLKGKKRPPGEPKYA